MKAEINEMINELNGFLLKEKSLTRRVRIKNAVSALQKILDD